MLLQSLDRRVRLEQRAQSQDQQEHKVPQDQLVPQVLKEFRVYKAQLVRLVLLVEQALKESRDLLVPLAQQGRKDPLVRQDQQAQQALSQVPQDLLAQQAQRQQLLVRQDQLALKEFKV